MLGQSSSAHFRPLAGIMVLIDMDTDEWRATQNNISVPLRGLWFLSKSAYSKKENGSTKISVPLRGLWFLSTGLATHYYLSYINFRPLAGIMVLISSQAFGDGVDEDAISVPLRGLWFLSVVIGRIFAWLLFAFPSPCGDYGSYQRNFESSIHRVYHTISVPLRGLWFLSGKHLKKIQKGA